MKGLDLKSMIIGALSVLLLFSLMGAGKIGTTFENLLVNQITMLDKNGDVVAVISDGYFKSFSGGKETAYLGSDDNGNGILRTYNNQEMLSTYLGTGSMNAGMLAVYNNTGQANAYLGADDAGYGLFRLKNVKAQNSIEMGIEQQSGDAYLEVFNPNKTLSSKILAGNITTYDKNGKQSTIIGTDNMGSGRFAAMNKAAKTIAFLGADSLDNASLNVYTKDGNLSGILGVNSGNASLALNNKSGNLAFTVNVDNDLNGEVKTYTKSKSVSNILTTNGSGDGLISANSRKGKAVATIGANANGQGFVETYNINDGMTAYMGTSNDENGQVRTWNKKGQMSTFIGTSKDGNGQVRTWNIRNNITAFLGTSSNFNGQLQIYNIHGYERGYIGLDSVRFNGLIRIIDEEGEVIFVEP